MPKDVFSVRLLIWLHHWVTLVASLVGILTFGLVRTKLSLQSARWIAMRRYRVNLRRED